MKKLTPTQIKALSNVIFDNLSTELDKKRSEKMIQGLPNEVEEAIQEFLVLNEALFNIKDKLRSLNINTISLDKYQDLKRVYINNTNKATFSKESIEQQLILESIDFDGTVDELINNLTDKFKRKHISND